tara:strand:- start:61068 stop:62969 length:1902 start_codon:yes stop_codon:yes gene_type:complete
MNYIILILFLIIGILIALFYSNNKKEGFADLFEKNQEDYYKARLNSNIPGIPEGDKFYKFNEKTQNLEVVSDDSPNNNAGNYYPVDNAVKQCKNMNSCDDLDNSDCGYCFYNDKFYYGDENGPKTDVCPNGWVKTKEECVKKRERAVCEKITNCHEMVGDAAICAWCPTKNKAYVYKEENGVIVPKYSDDKCDDIDQVTGSNLGLILNKDCSSFNQQHPCVGPNENTGPHSTECLNKLWKTSGCSSSGTAAPSANSKGTNWWNQRSWKAVFDDMKEWYSDATGSDWNRAKTHMEGCLGVKPDPCDPKYGGPLECYQKQFISLGCSKDGKGFPTSKPSQNINDFENMVKKLISDANNKNLPYNTKNQAYEKCYGGSLKPPPSIKVGDRVSYTLNVGGGHGAVCADTTENATITFTGYVCKSSGTNKTVIWDTMTNPNPATRCGSSSKTWSRKDNINNVKWISMYMGYCGISPSYFNNTVKSVVDASLLTIVQTCNDKINCEAAGCGMKNLVRINEGIHKNDVNNVVSNVKSIFNSTEIATFEDIQYLVDIGMPYCSCGWITKNGSLTSAFPSVVGTSSGCGRGKVSVISCGDNGPSWSGHKTGIYVNIHNNPEEIVGKLKKAGINSSVVLTIGK